MYHVPTVGMMQNFVVVFCLRCQFFSYFCKTKNFLRKSDEYETIGDIPPCGFDPLDGCATTADLASGEEETEYYQNYVGEEETKYDPGHVGKEEETEYNPEYVWKEAYIRQETIGKGI